MSKYACIYCSTTADTEYDMAVHQTYCDRNRLRLIDPKEFEKVAKQVEEIHQFIGMLSETLNNPMIRAMVPPNMRGMLG